MMRKIQICRKFCVNALSVKGGARGRIMITPYSHCATIRSFSSKKDGDKGADDDGQSFRDTLNNMKKEFNNNNSNDSESTSNRSSEDKMANQALENIKERFYQSYYFVVDNVEQAWDEMLGRKRESTLEKIVSQADTFRKPAAANGEVEEVEEEKYSGPNALVIVKKSGSAWEQMKNRLQDSPLIQELLKRTRDIGKAAAETPAGKTVKETLEGAQSTIGSFRDKWETSQHPLVYFVAGVIDNFSAETEEGMAIAAIRKLDPDFVKEVWAEDVKNNIAPIILKGHLEGDIKALKPWCGEAAFNKLAADIRLRKADGHVFDPNILAIEENSVKLRLLPERGGAFALIMYMVQVIDCVKNRTGEIVEGGENNIKAKFYAMALQQVYDEDTGVVRWQVMDFMFQGDIPYL